MVRGRMTSALCRSNQVVEYYPYWVRDCHPFCIIFLAAIVRTHRRSVSAPGGGSHLVHAQGCHGTLVAGVRGLPTEPDHVLLWQGNRRSRLKLCPGPCLPSHSCLPSLSLLSLLCFLKEAVVGEQEWYSSCYPTPDLRHPSFFFRFLRYLRSDPAVECSVRL